MEPSRLVFVDSMAKAADLMRWLGERRPLFAVDTETEGFELFAGDRVGHSPSRIHG